MPSRVPWTPRVMLVVLVAVAALMAPSGALADGGVTLVNNQIRFDSDSQDAENLVVTRQTANFECAPRSAPCVQLANGPQNIRDEVAGTGCVQVINTVVACDPAIATSIFLKLDDGDDFAVVAGAVPAATMDGGPGADTLTASGANADVLGGGDGDDSLSVGFGNDDVAGGAGTDTVFMDAGDDTVRLDEIANDGRAGEAKNVHSDVEVINGGGGSDNLFGSAAGNTLRGGSGNDLVDGGGGRDVLEGGAGADDLAGGPDVDLVSYPDAAGQTVTLDDRRDDGAAGELDNVRSDVEDVAAGAGNDVIVGSDAANVLDGGTGDDRLDGRGGADSFLGGAGADALFARDGLPERLECGTQADTGEADTIDQLVDCEGVALSSDLVPDADGDGSSKPADCDDGNPAINPGARDIPGNAVNEDCRGGAAPFPVLPSTITTVFEFPPGFTRVSNVTIRRARKGSTLRITCKGKGCPFRTRARKLKRTKGKLTISRPLGKAKLKPGTRFEVRLTKPRTVGLVARYTMRRAVIPARKDRCVPPGAKRLIRCPA